MSPFKRETYHLPEYQKRHSELGTRREVFNYMYSSLRNYIERTFGVWKARFKILKGINNYPMEKQVMIPVACVIVHNFIRMVQDVDPILEVHVADGVSVGEHVDVNVDVMLADGADDLGPSTGRQQDASRRGAMNQLREVLADDMWDRYQRFLWYKST